MTERTYTEQEEFWASDFGDEYIGRNQGEPLLAAKTAILGRALATCSRPLDSVLELGSNVGLNLQALRRLLPEAQLAGVEINAQAHAELAEIEGVEAHLGSVVDFRPGRRWDMVLCMGFLIHVPPETLPGVYETVLACAERYILVNEYYNPAPVEVSYRGHEARMWKRDFAGDLLDLDSSLRLAGYGFGYRRDVNFPQDDTTWFLLERAPA